VAIKKIAKVSELSEELYIYVEREKAMTKYFSLPIKNNWESSYNNLNNLHNPAHYVHPDLQTNYDVQNIFVLYLFLF